MTFFFKSHDLVMENIIMPGRDICKQLFTPLTICKPTSIYGLIVMLCFLRERFHPGGTTVGYDLHLHECRVVCSWCHCCFHGYSGIYMSDEKKNK